MPDPLEEVNASPDIVVAALPAVEIALTLDGEIASSGGARPTSDQTEKAAATTGVSPAGGSHDEPLNPEQVAPFLAFASDAKGAETLRSAAQHLAALRGRVTPAASFGSIGGVNARCNTSSSGAGKLVFASRV